MIKALRAVLWLSTAIAATATTVPVSAAQAAPQENRDASSSDGLGDIVVTAQKRPENAQKTPISISVLSSDDLKNRHVLSLIDLATAGTPSLRVTPYGPRPFSLMVNIRGVGVMSDTNQPARDQGVGIYVDGVYLGRPQGLNAALFDVERIEVLKGPQGTLFGRNTEGGALSIVTRKPTGKFGLDVAAGVGNFGSYTGEIHLNLPEVRGLSVKVDGVVNARDGIVENPLTGASDFGAFSRRGVHATVMWKPVSDFTATYSYDSGRDSSTTLYNYAIAAGTSARAPILPLLPHRVSVASLGVPESPSIGKQSGHSVNLNWQVAPTISLRSISSYRELSQTQFDNSSANTAVFTPNAAFSRTSLAQFDQYQYSEELQLIGETDRFRYVVGAMGYYEHVRDNAQTFNAMRFNANGTAASIIALPTAPVAVIPALLPGIGVDRASRVGTQSYGAFGQATWTPGLLEERVHLTAGGRWTYDKKDGQLYIVNNALPIDDRGVSRVLGFNKSWSRFDPMVNLAIDLTQNINAYGKWSTGYKSGGANSRALGYSAFNPEGVSMLELGVKSEFWNRKARINVAAYSGAYKDIQLDFQAPYYTFDANGQPIISASTTRTTSETFNAPGTGRVRGVEAEIVLAPVRGLTLSGNYAYNYVHIPNTSNPYPTYVPGAGMVVDPTPIRIYQYWTPKHAASASADYTFDLAEMVLSTHLDANWDSGSYNTDRDPSPTLKAQRSQPGLVVNGRVSLGDILLGSAGSRLTVSVWVRNIFNEEHLFNRSTSVTGGISGYFNEPRTFGVEARVAM